MHKGNAIKIISTTLLAAFMTTAQVVESEVELRMPNGLAGIGTPKPHIHGKNCVSVKDRENMRCDLQKYIRDFGPLSQAGLMEDDRKYPIFPVGAREWEDLIMANYVDMNPDEGSY